MKKIMLPLCAYLIIFSLLTFTGCTSSEINIEKAVESESENEINHEVYESEKDKTSEPIKLGEKFFAENLAAQGESEKINMSVDKAEVYNSLNEAGIQFAEVFPDSLYDGLNYDIDTDTFINNRVLVKLYITVENIDATSEEHAIEPENYGEYDFRVDSLGSCTAGPIIYSSKHNEVSSHYFGFHLEPNQSTQIESYYLVDLRETDLGDVLFTTAASPESGLGTVVDLDLE
ncbi:MAG: hypothetical protein NC320_07310 [Clostridium sp.]|nr:hypothetical protein [Clostridium sp.]